LYVEKSGCERGSPEYTTAKLKVNSFIGRIIKRTYDEDFYLHCCDDKCFIKGRTDHSRTKDLTAYTYIIAKAREFLFEHLEKAIRQGARILQANTDGFFTNKRIEHDSSSFLGSLREEYVAHNLSLFSCNQYACDEEVCIAGLPKGLYNPEATEYE